MPINTKTIISNSNCPMSATEAIWTYYCEVYLKCCAWVTVDIERNYENYYFFIRPWRISVFYLSYNFALHSLTLMCQIVTGSRNNEVRVHKNAPSKNVTFSTSTVSITLFATRKLRLFRRRWNYGFWVFSLSDHHLFTLRSCHNKDVFFTLTGLELLTLLVLAH